MKETYIQDKISTETYTLTKGKYEKYFSNSGNFSGSNLSEFKSIYI